MSRGITFYHITRVVSHDYRGRSPQETQAYVESQVRRALRDGKFPVNSYTVIELGLGSYIDKPTPPREWLVLMSIRQDFEGGLNYLILDTLPEAIRSAMHCSIDISKQIRYGYYELDNLW